MTDNIVHVIINDFARSYLEEAFTLNNSLEGNVISLKDDLTIGPVKDLNDLSGRSERLGWLSHIYPSDPNLVDLSERYSKNCLGDFEIIDEIKTHIKANKKLIIWLGTDSINQLGFARLCHTLGFILTDAYIIPLSEARINTKVAENLIPKSLVVLKPEQMAGMFNLIRPVKKSEIESSIKLWEKLSAEKSFLRTLSEMQVVESVEADFFDSYLLFWCNDSFQKAARVIGNVLCDVDFEVNDRILDLRLQELVRQNKLEVKGVLRLMRDYEVRLPQIQSA